MSEKVTVKLEGQRAKRGVALADFERFIDNFLRALRGFDLDRRGEEPQKAGKPDARSQAITSFRLVGFRKGSGIALIEPEPIQDESSTESIVEVEDPQMENLRALIDTVESEVGLSLPVLDSLDQARRTVGDDGTVEIDVSGSPELGVPVRNVMIDSGRLGRIRERLSPPKAPETIKSVSGRLHRVEFEPDKLAIRGSDGVDWICSYPEELESEVQRLANRLVLAKGHGELKSPAKGSMRITEIQLIQPIDQPSLFSTELIPAGVLEDEQTIQGPQGLDAFAVDKWTDEDEAYLNALTND